MNPEAVSKFISNLDAALASNDPQVETKAAERQNVSKIRELYSGLLDPTLGVGQLFADDVELIITGPVGGAMVGQWKGRDEVLQGAGKNFGLLEDQRPDILSLVAQGEQVVVIARERGRVRSTGKAYDVRFVQLFTLRDGRIAQMVSFCDDPSALAG